MIPLFRVFMSGGVREAVSETLYSGHIAQGSKVDEFETALKKFLGTESLVTVNSGTSALDLAFALLNIRQGDYVISTPMTCVATNIMLVQRGAHILWADVNRETGLIDPWSIEQALKQVLNRSRVRAIVTVDWGGAPCNYDAIREVAREIPIVEDAAHAFGAEYDERPIAQSGGDYVAWSFQAIKHLTTGDGGALKVPVEQLDRAKRLRWFGYDRSDASDFRTAQDLPELGYKYHMNDVAASIGLENLQHMKSVLAMHRDNAEILSSAFEQPEVFMQSSSWWVFTVRTERRSELIEYLKALGIQSSPVHRRNDEYSAIKRASSWGVDHAGVDEFAATELAIPCGWWVNEPGFIRAALRNFRW